MRRSIRLSVGLAAALSLVACSLLVDTAGLGDGAAEPDAAPDSTRNDARTDDDVSAPPADAATDTPTDAPDAATKCIDGPTRFCDDFDSPLPGSKWTSTNERRGAVTFDDVGLSPPRAMHATLAAGSGFGEAQLVKALPGNPPSVHCELDMKLDGVLATGETDVLSFITQVGGLDRHDVYMANFGGTWFLAEFQEALDGGGPKIDRSIALGAGLPDATWFHVVADVTPTAATLTANGSFIKLDSLSTPVGSAHRVQVGVTYADAVNQSGGVYIDNVDCRALP